MKTLLGLLFSGLFLYQSIILLENYNSKGTFRTIKEVDIKGPMPSPLVLICKDPGSLSISELAVSISQYTKSNTTLQTIATVFKVITANCQSRVTWLLKWKMLISPTP